MKNRIPVYDIDQLNSYQKKGISVGTFANHLSAHPHLQAPHRHSFYHLVLFTEGEGKQQLDFKTFEIKPGTIYFMVPGQVHQWVFNSNPDGYIINFSANYFSSFLRDQNYLDKFVFFSGNPSDQVLNLDHETTLRASTILNQILVEGNREHIFEDDAIKILLLHLFMLIAENQPAKNSNNYNHTLLQNFKQLIEQNYTQLRLPKQYAALLYITPNHLNAICSDFLGLSAGQLIRERVLLEAKRLLINLDLTIYEIAEKLGFEDQSYFIKFFKKYEGNTPDKFRKQNHINYE